MNKYNVAIGIEMHCELTSNSKVFSNSKNEFNDLPNSNVNAIDMALPGILPIVNMECIKKAIKMALILNCKIPEYMYFDRKNYYYPDLPKGYQITQMHDPIGINGKIKIPYKDDTIDALIHDIHLEEDTASIDHYSDFSLINYNRCGVPLLELVTEPCFNNADEVIAFLEYIRRCYQYADISLADTKMGHIRCDVNVSISDNDTLGTKVEMKGINTFQNVYNAINAEIERQTKLKDDGRYDEVLQETRRYDEESNTTSRMRSKVDAIDYKYFVEPNIPKFKITDELINEIKKSIPMMPMERKNKYINELGLSEYDTNIIIKEKDYAEYFEKCVNIGINPKTAANYLTVNIISYLNKTFESLKDFYITPEYLKIIIDAMENGTISSKQAKDIFNKSVEEKKNPKEYLTNDNAQISDKFELESIIDVILSNNEEQVNAYHNGKSNLFDFFVGQVMKETKGKANPNIVKEILNKKLGN